MKKIFSVLIIVGIIVVFAISCCGETLLDGRKCDVMDFETIKIFQTVDDKGLALATVGEKSKYTGDIYYNGMVILYVDPSIKIYDDLVITLKEHEVFVVVDTYTYKSKGAGMKTVPVVWKVDKVGILE